MTAKPGIIDSVIDLSAATANFAIDQVENFCDEELLDQRK